MTRDLEIFVTFSVLTFLHTVQKDVEYGKRRYVFAVEFMDSFRCWRVRPFPPFSEPTHKHSNKLFVSHRLGGMCGAIVTSPFDVVKTRLQSSLFKMNATPAILSSASSSASSVSLPLPVPHHHRGGLLYHFVETGHIIKDIYNHESPRPLFKGLGPTLIGVIPARSINFWTYGNGKHVFASQFNNGKENAWVHLMSAAVAGIVTGTATNPV